MISRLDWIGDLFVGDGRVNEHIGLIATHTVFHREHNRIEEGLHQLNPHWGGERLFQVDRQLVPNPLPVGCQSAPIYLGFEPGRGSEGLRGQTIKGGSVWWRKLRARALLLYNVQEYVMKTLCRSVQKERLWGLTLSLFFTVQEGAISMHRGGRGSAKS